MAPGTLSVDGTLPLHDNSAITDLSGERYRKKAKQRPVWCEAERILSL